MVWAADVDVWESVRGVEEFIGSAEVWDGFPDEHWFFCVWDHGFAAPEDGGHKADATRGGADKVKGFGEEKGGRERIGIEAEFWSGVAECA